jgi:hypothetical protein
VLIEDLRHRLGELVETLSVLDDRLAADDAGRLPGLAVARLAIAVDEAAAGVMQGPLHVLPGGWPARKRSHRPSSASGT